MVTENRLAADLRATRLFLALRLYHLEHGKLPETLEELAPEYIDAMPQDPVNGKPFVYEPTGSPPLLVSLGANGKRDVKVRASDEFDDTAYELKFAGDE